VVDRNKTPVSESTLILYIKVVLLLWFRRRPWAGGWRRRSWRRLRGTKKRKTALGKGVYMAKRGRPRTGNRPNTTIRIYPDILHQGRVAAVIQKKTLGRWLEEAILEKIERDKKLNKA